jgi:chromosome partitioning protein
VARETRLRTAIEDYALWRQRNGMAGLDYVFIDCPPSLGLLTVNAFAAATEVCIPIQCEYYALEGVDQLMRNIDLIRRHLNPSLRVSTIVLTMFPVWCCNNSFHGRCGSRRPPATPRR